MKDWIVGSPLPLTCETLIKRYIGINLVTILNQGMYSGGKLCTTFHLVFMFLLPLLSGSLEVDKFSSLTLRSTKLNSHLYCGDDLDSLVDQNK